MEKVEVLKSPVSRFVLAAAIANAGILYALERPLDISSLAIASTTIPLTAFALALLSRPTIRGIHNPERAAMRMAERAMKAIAVYEGLSRASQRRVSDVFMQIYKPLVEQQYNDLWEARQRDTELDERLESAEARVVSLSFVTGAYLLSALLVWFGPGGFLVPQVDRSPEGFLVGLAMYTIATAFVSGLGSEYRSYRRLMREEVPLLTALDSPFGSDYWASKENFLKSELTNGENEFADRQLKAVRRKRSIAKLGEIEREWIERKAIEQGVDTGTVERHLAALSSVERESSTPLSFLLLFLVASVPFSLAFLTLEQYYPSPVVPLLLSIVALLLAASITLTAAIIVIARLRSRRVLKDLKARLGDYIDWKSPGKDEND